MAGPQEDCNGVAQDWASHLVRGYHRVAADYAADVVCAVDVGHAGHAAAVVLGAAVDVAAVVVVVGAAAGVVVGVVAESAASALVERRDEP